MGSGMAVLKSRTLATNPPGTSREWVRLGRVSSFLSRPRFRAAIVRVQVAAVIGNGRSQLKAQSNRICCFAVQEAQ
jgi:hypothetical protein